MVVWQSLANRWIAPFLVVFGLFATGSAKAFYEEDCHKGREHLLKEDYGAAVTMYGEAINANGDVATAYVGRALAYLAKGQHADAIKDCERAIRLDEEQALAHVVCGSALFAEGRLDEAKTHYDRALEIDPKHAGARAGRAAIFHKREDYDGALNDYDRAIELDPKNATLYLRRAQVYVDREYLGQAIRDYSEAVELNPKSAPYRYLRAITYFENRNYDKAIADCKQALALDKKLLAALGLKGASLYHKDDYDGAIAELEKVVDENPTDAVAWYLLGRSYHEKGELDDAVAQYKEAIKANGRYRLAYDALADACDEMEEDAETPEDKARIEKHRETLAKRPKAGEKDDPTDGMFPEAEVPYVRREKTLEGLLDADSRRATSAWATEEARRTAENERQIVTRMRDDAVEIAVEEVVPNEWRRAEDLFDRSQSLFDKEKYEVAEAGFREGSARYGEVFSAFEKTVGEKHTLWLGWARQRADQLTGTPRKDVLPILAEALAQLGDRDGYLTLMDECVSSIQALGVLNPDSASSTMLSVAKFRDRCGDPEGAKEAVKEAAEFCKGITHPNTRAVRLARCAGIAARHGDTATWNTCMAKAMEDAQADRVTHLHKQQMLYAKCVAYAEAGAADEAYSFARQLEQYRIWSRRELFVSAAYARSALAAARGDLDNAERRRLFEKSYVAATVYLHGMTHYTSSVLAVVRVILADADLATGDCGRAWAGSMGVPGAAEQSGLMTRVIREVCARGQLELARKMLAHLPPESDGSKAVCLVAEAEVRHGKRSLVNLRQWVEELPTPRNRIAALTGIALGVKAGRPASESEATEDANSVAAPSVKSPLQLAFDLAEQGKHAEATVAFATLLPDAPDDAPVHKGFDTSAALAPSWWLSEAVACTNEVEDPCVRACLWVQIARAHSKTDNADGYRSAVGNVAVCSLALCNRFLERRFPAKKSFNGMPYWSDNARQDKAEFAEITVMLKVLLDLEQVQQERGDTDDAVQTLFMAMRFVELMPKDKSFSKQVSPQCAAAWLMRIAGRFTRLGCRDLADMLVADGPWFPDRFPQPSRQYLLSLAAVETNDVTRLEELEARTKKSAESSRGSTEKTHAARVNALLALAAARRGDRDLYRTAAMKVGGYASRGYYGASKRVFLELAEAATAAGQPDAALQYAEQAGARGPESDAAYLTIAKKLGELGRVPAAREVAKKIEGEVSALQAFSALATAEASADSTHLSSLYTKSIALPEKSERAATLAGIAAALGNVD